MTIKHLYPTSRPSLDLQFARDKKLDPRITYSRSSSGTYVDAGGVIQSAATNVARFDHNPSTLESLGLLVEEARTNSNTYSEYFHVGNWTITSGSLIPNNVTAPNNTLTAQKLVTSTATAQQRIVSNGFSVPAGTYTFSVYVKAAGFSFMRLEHGADTTIVNFDLAQGVLGTNTGNGTIINVGNGWYKCSMQIVASTTLSDIRIYVIGSATDARGSTLAGNGVGGIYIWGAQVELGAFPTSYIPTPATFTGRTSTATYYDSAGVIQTALTGVARSNAYFPDSNGVFRSAGLLLEAAGTNLLTYSQEFDNAAWAKSNASITANAIAAPDGTTTADKLYEDSTNNPHYINSSYTFANGTQYTYSVFVKAAERTRIQLWVPPLSYFTFNTAAPSGNYQLLANGWYRVWTTFTGTGATYQVQLGLNDGVSNSYQGNGTSGIYIWGAQLETGSYPTSYIPTVATTVTRSADTSTSATVTRSADVANMTGANFSSWFNKDAGSFVSIAQTPSGVAWSVAQIIGGFGNGVYAQSPGGYGLLVHGPFANNVWQPLGYAWNSGTGGGGNLGGNAINIGSGNYTLQNRYGFMTWSGTESKFGINGILSPEGVTGAAATAANSVNKLVIGHGDTIDAYYLPPSAVHVKRLAFYPARLSDTILQNISK